MHYQCTKRGTDYLFVRACVDCRYNKLYPNLDGLISPAEWKQLHSEQKQARLGSAAIRMALATALCGARKLIKDNLGEHTFMPEPKPTRRARPPSATAEYSCHWLSDVMVGGESITFDQSNIDEIVTIDDEGDGGDDGNITDVDGGRDCTDIEDQEEDEMEIDTQPHQEPMEDSQEEEEEEEEEEENSFDWSRVDLDRMEKQAIEQVSKVADTNLCE